MLQEVEHPVRREDVTTAILLDTLHRPVLASSCEDWETGADLDPRLEIADADTIKRFNIKKEGELKEFPLNVDLNNIHAVTDSDLKHLQYLQNYKNQLDAMGFLPADSIHSPAGQYFYKNVLKCPAHISQILESGYKPGRY